MSTYNVQWSSTQLDRLADERYAHFFAIVHHGEVVLIGNSYREDLSAVIQANIDRLDLGQMQFSVYLGRIREVGTGSISVASVNAIMDLLVFARKPRYNGSGKYVYKAASDLQLLNVGCEPIPSKLRVENSMVFVSRAA